MSKKRKPTPLGPAWLADMVRVFDSWKLASLIGAGWWLLRHWRGVGAVFLAGGVFVWSGSLVVAGVALAVVYGASRWRPAKRKARWWDEATLSSALVDAGLLRMDGDKLPTLSYQGKPQHSEHGTTVVVGLPKQKFSVVARGVEDLAANLRVPLSRLSVTQEDEDAANVARIHVGTIAVKGKRKESAATVAAAPRSDWTSPVRIGFDPQGHPIELATVEHNSLLAGRPGSGKTSLARQVLAHYLLDESTAIYLLDGKGSVEDYGAARPMCARFVSGTDDDAVPDTMAMLTEVLGLVRSRNSVGGDHPGVLLLLEEFQDVRAAAGRDQRDQLDATLGRIVRMGRAVSVHVLVSTQRPTTDDLPAGTRNLLSQRVALMLRNAQDAGLVLGAAPSLALPKRRGQALFTDGGPVVGVELDRLTDLDWRKVCRRAAALRTPARPTLTLAPSPMATDTPGTGLADEVVTLLTTEGPLSASELHHGLSPGLREEVGTARDLGVLLALHPARVERVRAGNGRVWRLTEAADSSARAW